MQHGIKGSELKEKSFATEEDLADHLENCHGMVVIRENETDEQATKRCAKKGIVPNQSLCQCQECKNLRLSVKNLKYGNDKRWQEKIWCKDQKLWL